MDTISRRSWGFSAVVHAAIIVVAFCPGGCSLTPPPPMSVAAPMDLAGAPPPAPKEQPISAKLHAAPLTLILEPEEAPSAPLPTLHQAMTRGTTWPTSPLIVPRNVDHPGEVTSIGSPTSTGTQRSPVLLPSATPQADDVIQQIRAHRTSNPALGHEERQLQATQEFLEDLLNLHLTEHWHIASHTIPEKRLIIEVMVTATGTVTAHLVNSSGDPTLDRLIDEWLASPDLRLPAIKPGIFNTFLVMVRR